MFVALLRFVECIRIDLVFHLVFDLTYLLDFRTRSFLIVSRNNIADLLYPHVLYLRKFNCDFALQCLMPTDIFFAPL